MTENESDEKFKAVDVRSFEEGTCEPSDGPYRAYPGVAYAGKCGNKDCKYHTKKVSWKKGMGLIRPNEDRLDKVVKCPSCKEVFVIQEIILYQCECNVEYVLADNDEIKKNTYNPSGSKYIRLGNFKNGVSIFAWFQMIRLNCKPNT
eukprot:539078_1